MRYDKRNREKERMRKNRISLVRSFSDFVRVLDFACALITRDFSSVLELSFRY